MRIGRERERGKHADKLLVTNSWQAEVRRVASSSTELSTVIQGSYHTSLTTGQCELASRRVAVPLFLRCMFNCSVVLYALCSCQRTALRAGTAYKRCNGDGMPGMVPDSELSDRSLTRGGRGKQEEMRNARYSGTRVITAVDPSAERDNQAPRGFSQGALRLNERCIFMRVVRRQIYEVPNGTDTLFTMSTGRLSTAHMLDLSRLTSGVSSRKAAPAKTAETDAHKQ